MNYTFSREHIIKSLTQIHLSYDQWGKILEETSSYPPEMIQHDQAYCKGIKAGLDIALKYLETKDSYKK